MTIALAPGSVIVFEGLDKAGKSTQVDILRSRLHPNRTTFAHMPSGFTSFSADVYAVLEDPDRRPSSGLAQQLAHLACHADNMAALRQSAATGALVLDRWWWSTLAYGWYSGAVAEAGFSESQFESLVKTVWAPIAPSVVFVFRTARERDSNNLDAVAAGYATLLRQNSELAVDIPDLTPAETTGFILDVLQTRGLVQQDGG
jgi:thymidylate kinase